MKKKNRQQARKFRHRRVRRRVSGNPERPRLAVYRSLKHIYAQLIDDVASCTVAAATSLDDDAAGVSRSDQAASVGSRLAAQAKELDITAVVFDRGGHQYHGRVKALAEAFRESGVLV